jgi:glutathione peroxidase
MQHKNTWLSLIFAAGSLLGSQARASCAELLNESFRPLAGKEKVSLCERFQGQVLLVINTASKCGYTPQYEGLEALHEQYKDRGFSVVGFPSNDFMNQEPGSEQQIQEFCTLTYGVKFPMFEKVHVKENNAVPFFRKLAAAADGHYPAWNFHKYLIDRHGVVVADFKSSVKPDDADLIARVEALLAEPASER